MLQIVNFIEKHIDITFNNIYYASMRTTIDINDELMRELKEKAHKSGLSLKKTINNALREGLKKSKEKKNATKYRCPVFSLGHPASYDLDRALDMAENLESEEIARKLKLRK